MIRRYRLHYKVPPLLPAHEASDSGARVGRLYDDNQRFIPWTITQTRDLDAFDAKEAWERLSYQLLAEGYYQNGEYGVCRYERVDIEPLSEREE